LSAPTIYVLTDRRPAGSIEKRNVASDAKVKIYVFPRMIAVRPPSSLGWLEESLRARGQDHHGLLIL
jgi:hypothetical protein